MKLTINCPYWSFSWRMRKIEKIQTLDQQTSQLKAENDELAGLAKKLKEQNYKLQQELRWHINNGSTTHRYLNMDNFIKELFARMSTEREGQQGHWTPHWIPSCSAEARHDVGEAGGEAGLHHLRLSVRTSGDWGSEAAPRWSINQRQIPTVFNHWNHVQTTAAFTTQTKIYFKTCELFTNIIF